MIHKTAIVDSKANIGVNVKIGPYSIIGNQVEIGDKTTIGPHVVIEPFVKIGSDCKIFQFAAIGAQPQDLKFSGEKSYVKIGKGTTIREFVTIHRGTKKGIGTTKVGKRCMLMAYAHVAHDCQIGNNVILSNNTTLAGHITIGNFATIGGLVAIHQFVRIGEYAFVGGKTAVVKDIPPFVIASGDRAKLHGLNHVGLKRHNFADKTIKTLKKIYRIVFRYGLTLNEAIERARAEVEGKKEIEIFLKFIETSSRGITR